MKPTIVHVHDLCEAKAKISETKANAVGVQIMALKAVHRLVKFEGVDPKTANIMKQEMLSRGGDVAVSEAVGRFEKEKTDIIIMGTLAQYIRLIKKLKKQAFDDKDCVKIANELQLVLFKDFDIETACVW